MASRYDGIYLKCDITHLTDNAGKYCNTTVKSTCTNYSCVALETGYVIAKEDNVH